MINISKLVIKALGFMDKKTHLVALDNFIYFEGNNIILQDAYKAYIHRIQSEEISNVRNFGIKKEDIIALKRKSAKYFLTAINENDIEILVTSKDEETKHSVPIVNTNLNLTNILRDIAKFKNSISTNGINLKTALTNYKENIKLEIRDSEVFINMNNCELNFNEFFGQICLFELEKASNSTITVLPNSIVESIGQFGLTKKNADIKIAFNNKLLKISKDEITILSFACKEEDDTIQ